MSISRHNEVLEGQGPNNSNNTLKLPDVRNVLNGLVVSCVLAIAVTTAKAQEQGQPGPNSANSPNSTPTLTLTRTPTPAPIAPTTEILTQAQQEIKKMLSEIGIDNQATYKRVQELFKRIISILGTCETDPDHTGCMSPLNPVGMNKLLGGDPPRGLGEALSAFQEICKEWLNYLSNEDDADQARLNHLSKKIFNKKIAELTPDEREVIVMLLKLLTDSELLEAVYNGVSLGEHEGVIVKIERLELSLGGKTFVVEKGDENANKQGEYFVTRALSKVFNIVVPSKSGSAVIIREQPIETYPIVHLLLKIEVRGVVILVRVTFDLSTGVILEQVTSAQQQAPKGQEVVPNTGGDNDSFRNEEGRNLPPSGPLDEPRPDVPPSGPPDEP